MARSSWKYHFYKLEELEAYLHYITDNGYYYQLTNRKTTLNKLNFFKQGVLHTGKYTIVRRFTKYHIGLKLGAFTKNRKPFYFRSKKKKNVTKKYPI